MLKDALNIQIQITLGSAVSVTCQTFCTSHLSPNLSAWRVFFLITCFSFTVSHSSMITITTALMGNLCLSWSLDLIAQDVVVSQTPVPSDPQHCSKHMKQGCTAATPLIVNCKNIHFLCSVNINGASIHWHLIISNRERLFRGTDVATVNTA